MTIENVTAQQIEQLRTDAGEAGDSEQVALCNRALTYDPRRGREVLTFDAEAIRACVSATNASEAMQ